MLGVVFECAEDEPLRAEEAVEGGDRACGLVPRHIDQWVLLDLGKEVMGWCVTAAHRCLSGIGTRYDLKDTGLWTYEGMMVSARLDSRY